MKFSVTKMFFVIHLCNLSLAASDIFIIFCKKWQNRTREQFFCFCGVFFWLSWDFFTVTKKHKSLFTYHNYLYCV